MKRWCSRRLAAVLLLLAASLQHAHPAAAGGAALDEAAIMRRLRQRANEAGLVSKQEGKWTGWGLDDPAHHCSWHGITCDASNHVTEIVWKTTVPLPSELNPLPNATTLLPELAQLQLLARLELEIDAPMAGLPPEWGQPGAFPSLASLVLFLPAFTAVDPLPALLPGALPRLMELQLTLIYQTRAVPLPPNWGNPAAWPSLRFLKLVTMVALPLPTDWAYGFTALQELNIRSNVDKLSPLPPAADTGRSGRSAPAPASGAVQHTLPVAWASGFPRLEKLVLGSLGLSGTFPAAWQASGSFPQLRDIELGGNLLSGPLPADIVCNLPDLAYLKLGDNQFTGGLPAKWAACPNDMFEIAVMKNQLTGPAFPPAWLAPNSTLDLYYLEASDNPGLAGPMPAALNWSHLELLYMRGTGVDGHIPAQWCRAPFAGKIWQIDTDAVRQPSFLERLPPCAARDMPYFVAWAKDVRQRVPGNAPSPARAGGPGKLLLVLLLLALLALLAAGAAAAAAVLRGQSRHTTATWAAWLRRRQRSRETAAAAAVAAAEEGLELLARKSGGQHNGQMQQRRPPLPSELIPGRARLKALAQRQLGGTALVSGRPEAELISLLKGMAAHSFPAAIPNGLTPASAGISAQPEYLSSTHGGGATVQLVRRWGLPTESLRVAAADMQFIAEPDGSLVQLGEGAHGVVFLAKLTDMYVAVKVLAVQPGVHSQAFWHEISLLARCVHPRIVPIHGVAMHGELLLVAMQLMLGGSLRIALMDSKWQDLLRWCNRGRRVALEVAEAVAYLHGEARILHSDIKSANVLLDQDWRAALTDLGVAQVMEGTARTAAGGSSLYAAPEQLLGERCTFAADIYSLGLLLTELTTRHLIVKRGQRELPRVPEDCPQDVADLIDQCLLSDPSQRPTAAEVLRRLRASGGGSDGDTWSG